MGLSLNVYAKYQWQNYGASNENLNGDGYRFKVKYFVPITDLWGGKLSYIGFTNFDWGSDLGDDPNRTSNLSLPAGYPALELRSLALLTLRVTSITATVAEWRKTESGATATARNLPVAGAAAPVVGSYNF